METAKEQRKQLASFLRSRRERLTPEAAGVLNSYGRRRTRGLRREELAALAGVSVTWYTWLEQARSIRVSRQVLTSLSRALRLDGLETEHLFRLAGEIPPVSHHPSTCADIPDEYLSFLSRLDPLPAAVFNSRFDVLSWNEGYCVLYPYFEHLPADERNLLLMTFDGQAQVLYPEWEQHAFQIVALFRSQNAEHLVQPEYTELVTRLQQRSPQFRSLWEQMDLRTGHPATRLFDHPVLGRIELEYVKMHLAHTDVTLVVHQPASEERVVRQFANLVEERARAQSPAGRAESAEDLRQDEVSAPPSALTKA
jgi:transcriptional regulator with XRE-family HTH domain